MTACNFVGNVIKLPMLEECGLTRNCEKHLTTSTSKNNRKKKMNALKIEKSTSVPLI